MWGTSRQVNRCLAPRLQEAPIALPLLEIHRALDAGCERRNIHDESKTGRSYGGDEASKSTQSSLSA
jgi:hypothetical protein